MKSITPLVTLFLVCTLAMPALAQFGDDGFGGGSDGKKHEIRVGASLDLFSTNLKMEMTEVEGLDDDGVTLIDPLDEAAGNQDAEYFNDETFYGIRGFVDARLAMGVLLGAHVRVGLVHLAVTNELGPGSVFTNNYRNATASSWGSIGFGAGLHLGYEVSKVRFLVAWEIFLTGGEFEASRFFDERVNGDLSLMANRIRGRVGYDLGFVFPFVQAGILIYDLSADLTEHDDTTPKTWDASFGAEDLFKLGLGAEFKGDKYVTARVWIDFLAETAMEVWVGLTVKI